VSSPAHHAQRRRARIVEVGEQLGASDVQGSSQLGDLGDRAYWAPAGLRPHQCSGLTHEDELQLNIVRITEHQRRVLYRIINIGDARVRDCQVVEPFCPGLQI
jgi:hypothetical protein